MSRSIHMTIKKLARDRTKSQMADPPVPLAHDNDLSDVVKKVQYKRATVQQRKRPKQTKQAVERHDG